MPHLGDCFNALRTLEFMAVDQPVAEEGEEPPPPAIPTNALGMVSKDGERVKFAGTFKISGAVEDWLGSLLEMMKTTLKGILDASLDSAANWELDRPRERWVRDYPGQIALLASQIYWTEESEKPEELEGATEDAM